MTIDKTSEVARKIGIHPNTVRLYEALRLIPKPERAANGYRIFTDFHIAQCHLIRVPFKLKYYKHGLCKKITEMLKASANRDFKTAILRIDEYIGQTKQEIFSAEEAANLTKQLLTGKETGSMQSLKRKEISKALDISMDTLPNWEMNGLLTVKRREIGYRIYHIYGRRYQATENHSHFTICKLLAGIHFAIIAAGLTESRSKQCPYGCRKL